jgi:hypothetical protein
LTPGGDIVLRGSELSSLAVRAGNGGNTFRIHDTPVSNTPGGLLTTVSTGGGNDLVTVDGTTGPLGLEGAGGSDTVNLGTGNQQTIRSSVTVSNLGGYSAVNVDDSADQSARTGIVYSRDILGRFFTVISGLTPGGDITLRSDQLSSLLIRAGAGGNTFRIHDTPFSNTPGGSLTTVSTGGGNDLVTVDGTTGPLIVEGAGGSDTVNLGKGNLQTIRSSVTVVNSGGYSAVNVDDSADNSARTGIIYNNGPANGSYTVISGLTPGGDIVLRGSELSSLAVRAGNGGNIFRIHDTPLSNTPGGLLTTVSTGGGNDLVTVDGTTGPLNVVGGGPNTTINLGNPNYDGVQHIYGAVNLQIFAGGVRTTLNVNDSGDKIGRTAVQTLPGMGFDIIHNLAPADIAYRGVQTGAVSITLGDGDNNTFTIENTNTAADSNPTTLTTGRGVNNTVNVLGTTSPLNVVGGGPNATVNVGNAANRLDDIRGPLTVKGQAGSTTLNVNDQGTSTTQTYTFTANTLTRAGLAPVTFDNLNKVLLYPASVGGNTINVPSVAAGVLANLAAANGDTVTLGANQSLASILGPVIVGPLNDNISASVVIDDSGNMTPPAGPITLSNDATFGFSISGLVPAPIYLGAGQNTTLNTSLLTGAGDKTFNMQAAPGGVALNLNAGSGTNTLDYTGYAGNVLVDLPLGSATGFSSISNIYRVTGASGGAPGSYNVLIGFGGNVLTGGTGRRNILVAGSSASTLNGGDQGDLLIGGTTAYDTEAGLVSWQAIAVYWAGTDDYPTQVANLTSGSGVPLLDATTVFGNGGGNFMNGNGELALIYSDGLDNFTLGPPYPPGFDPNSVVVPITP